MQIFLSATAGNVEDDYDEGREETTPCDIGRGIERDRAATQRRFIGGAIQASHGGINESPEDKDDVQKRGKTTVRILEEPSSSKGQDSLFFI